MQAPTLSQTQMRKALKKKIAKKSIRNVLSKPTTSIWPEITASESEELFDDMKEYFYCNTKTKILWGLVKNTPKNQRKELRKKLRSNKHEKPEFMKLVVFGLNEITRGLEKKIISSILVTADVNPQQMIRHLCYSCIDSDIPILVVPNLRERLKNIVGFPTVAIGFKIIPNDCPLFKIYKSICKFNDRFKIERDLQENIQVKSLSKNDSKGSVDNTIVNDDSDVYLYRNNINRVFGSFEKKNSFTTEWNSDFIEFNDKDTENNEETTSVETSNAEVPYVRPILQHLIYSDQDLTQNQTELKNNRNSIDGRNITLRSLNKVISKVDRSINNRKKLNKTNYLPVKIKRLQSNPKRKHK